MADYMSIVQAMGIVVMAFCFFAYLFTWEWFRWAFIIVAQYFMIIMVNVARETAEANNLTDIETLCKTAHYALIFILILTMSVYGIFLLLHVLQKLNQGHNEKIQKPEGFEIG